MQELRFNSSQQERELLMNKHDFNFKKYIIFLYTKVMIRLFDLCFLVILFGSCTTPSNMRGQMDFFEVMHKRRSVRSYRSTPVPQQHITKILDAARMAPTAGNQQPWKFLVIQNDTTILRMKKACIEMGMKWFQENKNRTEEELRKKQKEITEYYTRCFSAPLFIVVLVDTKSKHSMYNHHDGPLAAGYLMLAARALGYGSVYYTDSIPEQVTKTILKIPSRYKRICITPIGIPDKWPKTLVKKELEELVDYEKIKL